MNKIRGFTFGWGAKRGEYQTVKCTDALEQLKQTGTEWISLSFWTWCDSVFSRRIYFDYSYTVTDADLCFIIKHAKSMNLKVCLKPVVNSRDGMWRGLIRFPDSLGENGTDYWREWFSSYTDFILHYAEIAEKSQCEMFCIGCEMSSTEHRTVEWNNLIDRVRSIYSGKIVYNANHGMEDGKEWFRNLDYIGISAYYEIARIPGSSLKEMLEGWKSPMDRLHDLYKKFHKKIIMMEIGCRSARGCAMFPWDYLKTDLPCDEDEQANFYLSAFMTFWCLPWIGGFFWWDWSHFLYDREKGSSDTGFGIYGKKAENIVREWYSR